MTLQRGDIVLVRFPFSSGQGEKLRPALVVQCDRNNARLQNTIIAMITTTIERSATEPTQLLIDLATEEGKESGLLHTSAVKCENLFTVEQQLIVRTVGRLAPLLMDKVDHCLRAALGMGNAVG